MTACVYLFASWWVHNDKGDYQRHCVKTKSRLVAKGFSQVTGIDFNETTSPTPASAPVKMIAVIANEKRLPINHLDVSQAFIQAPLKEEIFPQVSLDKTKILHHVGMNAEMVHY